MSNKMFKSEISQLGEHETQMKSLKNARELKKIQISRKIKSEIAKGNFFALKIFNFISSTLNLS